MLAASDGTTELDVSDIGELAGTGVIILHVIATKAKSSKGKVQNWTCTGTFEANQRSQKDDDGDVAAEASARGAEESSGYGGARISPQPPAPTIYPRFAPPLIG